MTSVTFRRIDLNLFTFYICNIYISKDTGRHWKLNCILSELLFWPVRAVHGRGRGKRATGGGTSGRMRVVLHADWHYLCASCPQSKDRALNIHREAFPGSSGLQQLSHCLGLWPMTLPPTSSESIFKVNYRVQWLLMADCSLKGLILKVYVEDSDQSAFTTPWTIVTAYPHTDPL